MQKNLNKAWLPKVKKRQDGVDKQQKNKQKLDLPSIKAYILFSLLNICISGNRQYISMFQISKQYKNTHKDSPRSSTTPSLPIAFPQVIPASTQGIPLLVSYLPFQRVYVNRNMSYFSSLLNEGQHTVRTISKLSFFFHTTAYLGCIFMSLDLDIFQLLFCVKRDAAGGEEKGESNSGGKEGKKVCKGRREKGEIHALGRGCRVNHRLGQNLHWTPSGVDL